MAWHHWLQPNKKIRFRIILSLLTICEKSVKSINSFCRYWWSKNPAIQLGWQHFCNLNFCVLNWDKAPLFHYIVYMVSALTPRLNFKICQNFVGKKIFLAFVGGQTSMGDLKLYGGVMFFNTLSSFDLFRNSQHPEK